MADGGELKITIVHDSKKHSVCLPYCDDKPLCVSDIEQAAQQVTQVPQCSQKLIFKGKSLTNRNQTLESLGIKKGSRIMVLGKKYDPEADDNMKAIRSVEQQVGELKSRLDQLNAELDGISKGFLESDLIGPAVTKVHKQIKGLTEALMKELLTLDSLSLDSSSQGIKGKRKTVVTRIQTIIDQADASSTVCDKLLKKEDL
ncbi:BAG family molecular chaperone regulator 1 [Nematostella vectensis]|uniref:BAG family molecular chaperone regulator 1 n=1 Tax=Nematostella vectensis TaxID=45351 RepID=UPI00138FC505|nr:BAG family molecular chaperone regulator 1 [Nematostella vectensis]